MDFLDNNPWTSCSNSNPNPNPTQINDLPHNLNASLCAPCNIFCPNEPPIASPFQGLLIEHDFDPLADLLNGESDRENAVAIASMGDLGFVDDPITNYMDFNLIEDRSAGGIVGNGSGHGGNCHAGGGEDQKIVENLMVPLPKHGRSSSTGDLEILEPRKTVPADKLAELWITDPKRAKRIVANRQSAARSKEKKARYTAELEKKVYTLEKEMSNLAMQLSVYQRRTSDLSSENTELKLRLQTMVQQAQMRDELNEALKREVSRLRFANGETVETLPKPYDPVNPSAPDQAYNVQLSPFFYTYSPEYIQSHPHGCTQWLDHNETCAAT